MEEKDQSTSRDWIRKLDEQLTKLGEKQGHFLSGKTVLYFPKEKKEERE